MKLCLYITLCACLLIYNFANTANPNLECLGQGEYCIYSTQIVSDPNIIKTVDLGYSYIYYCDSSDTRKVRALFTKIDGESITLKNTTARKILQKLRYRKVSTSDTASLNITYAYSPRGKSYITSGNQKINLQIATSENILTVGWPVILGSY